MLTLDEARQIARQALQEDDVDAISPWLLAIERNMPPMTRWEICTLIALCSGEALSIRPKLGRLVNLINANRASALALVKAEGDLSEYMVLMAIVNALVLRLMYNPVAPAEIIINEEGPLMGGLHVRIDVWLQSDTELWFDTRRAVVENDRDGPLGLDDPRRTALH